MRGASVDGDRRRRSAVDRDVDGADDDVLAATRSAGRARADVTPPRRRTARRVRRRPVPPHRRRSRRRRTRPRERPASSARPAERADEEPDAAHDGGAAEPLLGMQPAAVGLVDERADARRRRWRSRASVGRGSTAAAAARRQRAECAGRRSTLPSVGEAPSAPRRRPGTDVAAGRSAAAWLPEGDGETDQQGEDGQRPVEEAEARGQQQWQTEHEQRRRRQRGPSADRDRRRRRTPATGRRRARGRRLRRAPAARTRCAPTARRCPAASASRAATPPTMRSGGAGSSMRRRRSRCGRGVSRRRGEVHGDDGTDVRRRRHHRGCPWSIPEAPPS